MTLFHGTDQIITVIDFSRSRLRTDFGRGFYLSDKLGNARDWAVDKSELLGTPTVMRYEIDSSIFRSVEVKQLRFEGPSIDWLNFVRDNRRKDSPEASEINPRHSFDIVSGPIANDKVAIAVDKYCRGVFTSEQALDEMRTIKGVYQLSMHTHRALTFIQSVSYSQRFDGKWSNWATSSIHAFPI